MRVSPLGLLALVGCTAPSARIEARPDAEGLGAIIRQLAVDSLRAGGTRAGAVLVAGDSVSAALLGLARVPTAAAPGPAGLVCPASTAADGGPAPPPVGYVVHVALAAGADAAARELRVTKSCHFSFRGRVRGFAEGGGWQLRRDGGRWRVAAVLDRWIT